MAAITLFSPYRICPIGAHIDHQGGSVLGRTINLGTTLTYESLPLREIQIISAQFGETKFSIGELDKTHWARYAQAAARVLNLHHGIKAQVSGSLIGSGLSSSASVGLSFLQAMADANEMQFSGEQLVNWDYQLEHDELGLQNGLLDPMSIVHGRQDALLYIDTRSGSVTPVFDPLGNNLAWIIAYSGVSRELTRSGFNVRVAECCEAAVILKSGAQKLGDVPQDIFEMGKAKLPSNLCRRAEHFFSEMERVRAGKQAWAESDAVRFGELMNRSCASSIKNYESGSEILIQLHEMASSAGGIYGSRFCGGGYGGCVVALADRGKAHEACDEIAWKFSALHPHLPSKVFVTDMADGLFPVKADAG